MILSKIDQSKPLVCHDRSGFFLILIFPASKKSFKCANLNLTRCGKSSYSVVLVYLFILLI